MDTLDQDFLEAEREAQEEVSPQNSDSDPKKSEPDDYVYRSQSAARTQTRASSATERLDPAELRRITTYRLQQRTTVGSRRGAEPYEKWLPFGAAKPYPPSLPDAEEYVVEFTGHDDPLHPHNWPIGKKYAKCLPRSTKTLLTC